MNFFVGKPVATAMIFAVVLVLGVYCCLHIPVELLPRAEFPQLEIEALWPGIPPEIMYARITSRLEEISSAVKGVKKVFSESRSGVSKVILDFETGVNMEFARLTLKEDIAARKDIFPPGITPRVASYVPEEFRMEPFLVCAVSGDHSLEKLRELIDDKVKEEIGSLDGVAGIRVTGGAGPVIRILLNKEKIMAFGIAPSVVHSNIQRMTGVYPSGMIKRGSMDCVLRVKDEISGIKSLRETVIVYSGKKPVRLRDIAQIFPSYEDASRINRINGQSTVGLIVLKQKGASTLKTSKAVKQKIGAVKAKLPPDLIFRIVSDESDIIRKNLRELSYLAGIILSIVFVLALVFLKGPGPSFLVISSVVFSVFLTINLIYFMGISLNMLTLGGLVLGFGLFVDNSIVVFENILRWRQRGFAPFYAAVHGAREVFLPVLASTLTSVSVFFSFAYFQGRMRVYYLPLAHVIALALSASMFVSFSLIPAMSIWILKKVESQRRRCFLRGYKGLLRVLLKHSLLILPLIVVLFLGSFRWFRSEVVLGEFFGWKLPQTLQISIRTPPGTPLEITDSIIGRFEEKILAEDFCKEVRTSIEPERAWIVIRFPAGAESSLFPWILKQKMIHFAARFAGIGVGIYGLDPQGYFSSPSGGFIYDSRIKIAGYSLKKLTEITSSIEKFLKRNPRVKRTRTISDPRSLSLEDCNEYVLRMEARAIPHFNIDPKKLSSYLRVLTQGHTDHPLKMAMEDKKIDLVMRFSDSLVKGPRELLEEPYQTHRGEHLRLKEISNLEQRPLAGAIIRENQQFQHTVVWEFKGPHKAAEMFEQSVFSKLDLPPGFSVAKDERDWEMTSDEKGEMKFAVLFSLFIIFMILASLFESLIQPFLILWAVPLALIGVFSAFVAARFPFDSSAYTGIILMMGISVNNSILLVDSINRERKKHSFHRAVLIGAGKRIRPIFLTTATTVFGMFPLVLLRLGGGGDSIWSSFALSTLGGVTSSALLTPIAVPVLYDFAWRIRRLFQRNPKISRKSRTL